MTSAKLELVPTVEVLAPMRDGYDEILTRDALDFVASLVHEFGHRLHELLEAREATQRWFDAGNLPVFPPETAHVRTGDWLCAPLPEGLLDRRVEITGPVDRKMVINALNSGASCFMADFEDSNSPTWTNCIDGQLNLRDAVRRTIRYEHPLTGKKYALHDDVAVLLVRPRGLHLPEKHLQVGGEPVPAALVDFGLFVFHNAHALLARGAGPWFYLPKLQHYLEARLWNEVFVHAEQALDLPVGTIKATVLLETLPAAFQMDEILYELRDHMAGLNCGRWDYIFSYIKTLRNHPDRVLPDRSQVGMSQHFMRTYTERVIRVCHRRGVHAMGGMAAQIPIKSDPEANQLALDKVRQDKLREVLAGHDGTWVAHPGLVGLAREVFDAHMPQANQIANKHVEYDISEEDLVWPAEGTRTLEGVRLNVRVGVQYLEAWLGGNGCVPLYNLMEDAATAEISRAQLWQWIRHGATLDDGTTVTADLVDDVLESEMATIRQQLGEQRWSGGRFREAIALFRELCTDHELAEFLTLPAYDHLLTFHKPGHTPTT